MSDGIVNRDEKENVDDCTKYTVLQRWGNKSVLFSDEAYQPPGDAGPATLCTHERKRERDNTKLFVTMVCHAE